MGSRVDAEPDVVGAASDNDPEEDDSMDPCDMVYVGRAELVCDTCDVPASSPNPFFRLKVKSKLRKRKFRPWRRYVNGQPQGKSCQLCVVTARRSFKARGGVKHLATVREDTGETNCVQLVRREVHTWLDRGCRQA